MMTGGTPILGPPPTCKIWFPQGWGSGEVENGELLGLRILAVSLCLEIRNCQVSGEAMLISFCDSLMFEKHCL